jgi:hypothetical protein
MYINRSLLPAIFALCAALYACAGNTNGDPVPLAQQARPADTTRSSSTADATLIASATLSPAPTSPLTSDPTSLFAVSSSNAQTTSHVNLYTLSGRTLSRYGGTIGNASLGNTLSTPSFMVFDASGNLYVADSQNNKIFDFPAAQLAQTTPMSALTRTANVVTTVGLAVSSDGTLAAANVDAPQLSVFSSGSLSAKTALNTGDASNGTSTTFLPGSGLPANSVATVLSEPNTSAIVICDAASCASPTTITAGVNSPGAKGANPLLAWNANNNELFLANDVAAAQGVSNLVYYKSSESFATPHEILNLGTMMQPKGLATSADGHVAIAECDGVASCFIYIYDSTNTPVSGWNPKPLTNVGNAVVAFSANDLLLIGSSTPSFNSGTASVYALNGALIASATLPGNESALAAATYP